MADVFGTLSAGWVAEAAQERYGLTADPVLGWHHHRERFDLGLTPKEAHRFGWAVEVDPFDPGSAPMKRTALSRSAHHGATVTESRGRAVVYMCDDSHLYRFVGAHSWRERLRDRDSGPLAEGTLYAARLGAEGSGTWAPLVHGGSGSGVGDGFADQADVLLHTREAAQAVGTTRLRRPGAPVVHPVTGTVHLSEVGDQGGGRILSLTEGTTEHSGAPTADDPRGERLARVRSARTTAASSEPEW